MIFVYSVFSGKNFWYNLSALKLNGQSTQWATLIDHFCMFRENTIKKEEFKQGKKKLLEG